MLKPTIETPSLDARRDDDAAVERAIRCAACGHAVTSARERAEIAGRHAHTFMNPSGIVFHVRCFRATPGVVERGPPSREATWFPGTAWTYAHCGGCGRQLGWRYVDVDGAGDRFAALVEDEIVEDGGAA